MSSKCPIFLGDSHISPHELGRQDALSYPITAEAPHGGGERIFKLVGGETPRAPQVPLAEPS